MRISTPVNPAPLPANDPTYEKYRHVPLPEPPNFNEADVSDKPSFVSLKPPLEGDFIVHLQTRYRCTLFRDTYPLMVKYVGENREELLAEAEARLVRQGIVNDGDHVVLTIGEPIGKSGGTNTMKIVKVGEHRA